jgi:hypothetical protein
MALRESQRIGGGRRAQEKDEDKIKAKAQSVDRGDAEKVGAKIIPARRAASVEGEAPEIDEIGFGHYLRYLIIAAIFIAIVIFIGGQALQVSKSMD